MKIAVKKALSNGLSNSSLIVGHAELPNQTSPGTKLWVLGKYDWHAHTYFQGGFPISVSGTDGLETLVTWASPLV